MKTLLSVDIDYWNYSSKIRRVSSLKSYLSKVTKVAKEKNIPIYAIMNHQQILPIANRSEARRIINVDTHSDLSEGGVSELECGTWVNYVKWRSKGEYVWIHKGDKECGDCSSFGVIFESKRPRKRISRLSFVRYKGQEENDIDWKSVKRRRKGAPDPSNLDLSEIVVCLSPDYSENELKPVFYEWKRTNNIPYIKGRLNESYRRKCKPTKSK